MSQCGCYKQTSAAGWAEVRSQEKERVWVEWWLERNRRRLTGQKRGRGPRESCSVDSPAIWPGRGVGGGPVGAADWSKEELGDRSQHTVCGTTDQ